MNNRDANKQNSYPNLSSWCDKYKEESGIKVHPSSVPVDLVLEDLIGYVGILVKQNHDLVGAFDKVVARLITLEGDLVDCKSQVLELQTPIEEIKTNKSKAKK